MSWTQTLIEQTYKHHICLFDRTRDDSGVTNIYTKLLLVLILLCLWICGSGGRGVSLILSELFRPLHQICDSTFVFPDPHVRPSIVIYFTRDPLVLQVTTSVTLYATDRFPSSDRFVGPLHNGASLPNTYSTFTDVNMKSFRFSIKRLTLSVVYLVLNERPDQSLPYLSLNWESPSKQNNVRP